MRKPSLMQSARQRLQYGTTSSFIAADTNLSIFLIQPMNLRSSITHWKPRFRKLPGIGIARFLYRLLKGTESRNLALLLLRPPKGLYQPYGTTSYDRYQEIFRYVRTSLGDGPQLRILSLGCSTGEEVFCLRSYFPQATILGLDINPFNIAVSRWRRLRRRDSRMSFAVAGSTVGQANASYDVIFAMAVFRHGDLNLSPPPSSSGHLIRFADFEESVADLTRILKPGGLLAIQNAMFRLRDTRLAKDFETVLELNLDDKVPLFDRNNDLLPDCKYPDVVFRKNG